MTDSVSEQSDIRAENASDLSPEARRMKASLWSGQIGDRLARKAGPGSQFFTVLKRVASGVLKDGFIHAGNFAYMSLLSLFPFFIAVAAILSAIGEPSQREASIDAFLVAVPPSVAKVIGPAARDAVAAREGWLLWVGGAFGLWTASSLIETIRDVLHRAYGAPPVRAFWEYRLFSIGLIFGSVLLLLVALAMQVAISAIQEMVYAWFPRLDGLIDAFVLSRLVGGLVLFGTLYLLFVTLTPARYAGRAYAKWPGPLLVASWWIVLIVALPMILRSFFVYDLTYGSLAGVMIALFFFWLVGLGLVVGAELNAALAETPEERDLLLASVDEDTIEPSTQDDNG